MFINPKYLLAEEKRKIHKANKILTGSTEDLEEATKEVDWLRDEFPDIEGQTQLS